LTVQQVNDIVHQVLRGVYLMSELGYQGPTDPDRSWKYPDAGDLTGFDNIRPIVLHRDLKHANVMWDEASKRVTIVDFGKAIEYLEGFDAHAAAEAALEPKGQVELMAAALFQAQGFAAKRQVRSLDKPGLIKFLTTQFEGEGHYLTTWSDLTDYPECEFVGFNYAWSPQLVDFKPLAGLQCFMEDAKLREDNPTQDRKVSAWDIHSAGALFFLLSGVDEEKLMPEQLILEGHNADGFPAMIDSIREAIRDQPQYNSKLGYALAMIDMVPCAEGCIMTDCNGALSDYVEAKKPTLSSNGDLDARREEIVSGPCGKAMESGACSRPLPSEAMSVFENYPLPPA